jgi:hypothetical protein
MTFNEFIQLPDEGIYEKVSRFVRNSRSFRAANETVKIGIEYQFLDAKNLMLCSRREEALELLALLWLTSYE